MNETSNFLLRHYSDSLIISLYQKTEEKSKSRKQQMMLHNRSIIVNSKDHYFSTAADSEDQSGQSLGTEITQQQEARCVFKTKLELNNIQLNEDKMSLVIVGTKPSRKSMLKLNYLTFEIDLLFKVKLKADPEIDNFGIALANYKMMKWQY